MLGFPPPPPLPDDQRAEGALYSRYEDITQDGRVALTALTQALGGVVWRQLLADHAIVRVGRDQQGVLPVLTRLILEGFGGPVSVTRPLSATGQYGLAHVPDADGGVDKIMLTMWIDVAGTIARTAGPPPPGHGGAIVIGRIYGEHVFTRLFAPPGQRKVRALAIPGVPPVPPTRHTFTPPAALLGLPAGATWLEPAASPAAVVAFGLGHTDSNQHVNSLVYPRLFEDALLGRLAELGERFDRLARYAECAYRKPCFAGERYRIALRAFRLGEQLGAVGGFAPADGGEPHCYLRMVLAD
jgi:hypothetical protein